MDHTIESGVLVLFGIMMIPAGILVLTLIGALLMSWRGKPESRTYPASPLWRTRQTVIIAPPGEAEMDGHRRAGVVMARDLITAMAAAGLRGDGDLDEEMRAEIAAKRAAKVKAEEAAAFRLSKGLDNRPKVGFEMGGGAKTAAMPPEIKAVAGPTVIRHGLPVGTEGAVTITESVPAGPEARAEAEALARQFAMMAKCGKQR